MAMITNDWLDSVSAEFKKPYYRDLYDFVKKEYNCGKLINAEFQIHLHHYYKDL